MIEQSLLLIPEDIYKLAPRGSLPLSQVVQFGPNSQWRSEIGDLRNFFTIFSGGLLQLAHPVIGDAIEKQSEFFGGTWARLDRSARGIAEIFLSDNATAVGHRIRNYHSRITGRDEFGETISALHPEPYTWGWLTILWAADQKKQRFDRRQPSGAEWEEWYQESRVGYRCQGVSDRFLPETYLAYQQYFSEVCRTRLKRTPAFDRALGQLQTGKVDRPPQIPPLLWNDFAQSALSKYLHVLAVGGLPEEVRDKLDIPLSESARRTLQGVDWVVRNIWSPVAPQHLSYHPGLIRAILPPSKTHQRLICSVAERLANLNFSDINSKNT